MRRPLLLAFVLVWLVLAGPAAPAPLAAEGFSGSGDGGGLRQVAAPEAAAPAEACRPALDTEDPVPDPTPPLTRRACRTPDVRPTSPRSPACAAWPAPIPILLLTQRQNE